MYIHNQRAACKNFLFNLSLCGLTLLNGCASTNKPTAEITEKTAAVDKKTESTNVDPYESFNRSIFKFNDHLDDYVAKPISDAYIWVTPIFFKTGVSNFFSNLKDINVVLNDSMQGKFAQSAEDTGRFLANSTLGLLGFFDVATDLGLKKHEEDFGQTLAVWGIPQGAYLVLPVLGPTTARGLPGNLLDIAANPSTYVGAPIQVVSMLNTRANAEGSLKFIDEAAIDPYLFTREAYLQNQQHLISDGNINSRVDVLPLQDDITREIEEEDARDAKGNTAKDSTNKTKESLDQAIVELNQASNEFEQSSVKIDELEKKLHKKKRHHATQHHIAKSVDAPTAIPEASTLENK